MQRGETMGELVKKIYVIIIFLCQILLAMKTDSNYNF